MATERWTVRRLLEWTEKYFHEKGLESPRLEAQILLAHVLKCAKIELYVRIEEELAEGPRSEFRDLIRKRAEGMPVAYLVGHREFFSLTFEVTPAVLIPRPETETLVVEAIRLLKGMSSPQVLDLGTGSGCIAITIAKQVPNARVVAVDLHPDALEVARRNAIRHQVSERVNFLPGDLFSAVPAGRFDMIVSNPPYIAESELPGLDRSVRDYEPQSALVAPEEGLGFYRRIIQGTPDRLKPGGWLLVEVGYQQSKPVIELANDCPSLTYTRCYNDLQNHPRVVSFQRQAGP